MAGRLSQPAWLGWRGSNARMQESKSCALPLGYIPKLERQGTGRDSRSPDQWGGIRGSNPRHPEPQSGALPTELIPPYEITESILTLARQEGLEPPAYCLEGSCSIRLSYWRTFKGPRGVGAGEGNRTLVPSLEGWYSTIELHPQAITSYKRITFSAADVKPSFKKISHSHE